MPSLMTWNKNPASTYGHHLYIIKKKSLKAAAATTFFVRAYLAVSSVWIFHVDRARSRSAVSLFLLSSFYWLVAVGTFMGKQQQQLGNWAHPNIKEYNFLTNATAAAAAAIFYTELFSVGITQVSFHMNKKENSRYIYRNDGPWAIHRMKLLPEPFKK